MVNLQLNRYRRRGRLLLGVAGGCVLAWALAAAGCGSFDALNAVGGGDAGPSAPVGQAEAQFNAFNNSPNLYPFRLCFKYRDVVVNLPPLPSDPEKPMPNSSYPGIAEGAAVGLPAVDFADLLGASVTAQVEVFAVRAKRVIGSTESEGPRCPDLVCERGSCLEKGPDYVSVGQVDLVLGGASALTIGGCPASGLGAPLTDTSICGTTYTAESGNLHAEASPLGKSTAPRSATVVKLLALPSGVSEVRWQSGDSSTLLNQTFSAVALPPSLALYATYGITMPTAALDGGAVNDAGGADAGSSDAGSSPAVFFSLAAIQELSDPSSLPNTFFDAGAYVVAILGSPSVGPAINTDGSRNAQPGALRVVALRVNAQ
jgi:hypothetical protein